jgi:hypothetical protein
MEEETPNGVTPGYDPSSPAANEPLVEQSYEIPN